MKALIVDDEKAAVVAVRLLVDWEKHNIDTVYEVNAVEDVLPIVRSQKIALIISDVRMPGMSGLVLAEEIQRVSPNTRIIMMSGFGQFEYVRKALQQGCVDYILKPIDEEQINQAVAKAVSEWRRDISLQNIEHSYREISGEKIIKQAQRITMLYLTSHNRNMALQELSGIMPGFQGITTGYVAHIHTMHLEESLLQGENDPAVLADEINKYLFESGRAVAVTRRRNGNIYIFADGRVPRFQSLCGKILKILYEKTRIHFPMGISDCFRVENLIPEAEVQSKSRALLCPVDEFKRDEPVIGENRAMDFELSDYEDKLHQAVLSGYDFMIEDIAARLAREVSALSPLTIYSLERFQRQYLGMRIRWVEGFRQNRVGSQELSVVEFPEIGDQLPFDSSGLFSEDILQRRLTEDLNVLANLFREAVGKKEQDNAIVEQIEQYILMHYTEKISIGQISEKFAISESYVSRSFKKKYGMGIPEYINQLRIEQAKKLMRNPRLRIAEIAWMVGYSDEKYMSRVFHRTCGMSPQVWRTLLDE